MARADNDEKLESAPVRRDRTHWLYLAVIAAVVLGIIVGLVNRNSALRSSRWARGSWR